MLAAHGSSKDHRINRPMFAIAETISRALPDVLATPAFLDGTPDVRTIIDEINAEDVLVVPFMASQGYYTDVVFPQVLQHDSKRIGFAAAIGSRSELARLVVQRVSSLAILQTWEHDYTIVVVGHGTRKNRNSCRTTIQLVKQLRVQWPLRKIEFAFIDQKPSIEHVVNKLDSPNVLVIPFLMGLGPHVTEDVPKAFGCESIGQAVNGDFQFPFVQSIADGLQPANPKLQTVAYDRPIGVYPTIASLCIDSYRQYRSKLEFSKEIA